VFAATAAVAWAADGSAEPSSTEGSSTPKMQGSDNGAIPTTPGNAMTPDRSTPDERHGDADRNSGASPSPRDIGPRGVPRDALRHKWPNSGGVSPQEPGNGADPGSTGEDQGTTDSQPAAPENPASPFSPVNPAAPALQDPQGGDPTNPVTPANMRYMIIA
jgi:hypothetical protein